MISGLFVLPLLVVGSGWTGGAMLPFGAASLRLLEGQLLYGWGGDYRQALLSAIVLAQCLHYYCVIYLLPRAEVQRVGKAVMSSQMQLGALAAASLMLAYYVSDYGAARKLYAVAAGAHAWLEWPVLRMALLSMSGQTPHSFIKAKI